MNEKSIFPVDGSLLAQSFSFISACDFINGYTAVYKKKKKEVSDKFKRIKGRVR